MQLPEIVTVGIYDSKVAAKNVKISNNRKTSMFELELPICESGISYIGSNSAPITENLIICAKPGQTRHTKFPFKCYFVHMILHEGILFDTLMNTPDFFETDRRELYKGIFEKMIKRHSTLAKSDTIMLQSLVLELIYTISRDTARLVRGKSGIDTPSPAVEKTINYIKNNLTEDLSLEALASSVSLSPIHFHNIFKRAVGKTLRDYVEEQRLKKAVELLISTNYSLTKIAFECGFSSQSYFSYVFKRKMKKTPREYATEMYSQYEI